MNKFFLKNLRFLPTLLLVPFVYLAAWLLPWREEGSEDEMLTENSIAIDDTHQPVVKELVTQA